MTGSHRAASLGEPTKAPGVSALVFAPGIGGEDRRRAGGRAVPAVPGRDRRPADRSAAELGVAAHDRAQRRERTGSSGITTFPRVHAELIKVGGEWTVTDDGLSAQWLICERRADRWAATAPCTNAAGLGETAITYRAPTTADRSRTQAAGLPTTTSLSPSRRRVLLALAWPGTGLATPATNQQITMSCR